jgi:hypothetical protein
VRVSLNDVRHCAVMGTREVTPVEEFIEQWRVDPEVVATATPETAVRDFVRSLKHDHGWCY